MSFALCSKRAFFLATAMQRQSPFGLLMLTGLNAYAMACHNMFDKCCSDLHFFRARICNSQDPNLEPFRGDQRTLQKATMSHHSKAQSLFASIGIFHLVCACKKGEQVVCSCGFSGSGHCGQGPFSKQTGILQQMM